LLNADIKGALIFIENYSAVGTLFFPRSPHQAPPETEIVFIFSSPETSDSGCNEM
jgi:hypothetical protein